MFFRPDLSLSLGFFCFIKKMQQHVLMENRLFIPRTGTLFSTRSLAKNLVLSCSNIAIPNAFNRRILGLGSKFLYELTMQSMPLVGGFHSTVTPMPAFQIFLVGLLGCI